MSRTLMFFAIIAIALTQIACHGLKEVEYFRTGGFAGVNDTITVTPQGKMEFSTRNGEERTAQLTREQKAELAAAFAGWDALAAEYKEGWAKDTFHYTIRYGDHAVEAGQLADTPAVFNRARQKLEELVKAVEKGS